jgi:hypothetical protein
VRLQQRSQSDQAVAGATLVPDRDLRRGVVLEDSGLGAEQRAERCVADLLSTAFDPPSNVRRAVANQGSSSGFEVAQKTDGLTIRQEQIRKVKHDNFAGR